MKITHVYGQVSIIVFIICLSFIGISLPYPIFAPLILNNDSSIVNSILLQHFTKPVLLAILLAAYPLGQFVGLPILGNLSDIIGRKKGLIITLAGTSLGYLISGFAIIYHQYVILLLSRLWTGLCEGNFAIAQAAMGDLSNQINKVKCFGWLNGGIALGYIIGPLLGGITAEKQIVYWFNYSLPFFLAMGLAIFACFIVFVYLQETYEVKQNFSDKMFIYHIKKACIGFLRDSNKIFKAPHISKPLIVFILFYIGIDLFYEFYPFYFVGRWQFSFLDIALFSAFYTTAYAISQLVFVPKLSTIFKPCQILTFIGLACGTTLILMILPKNYSSLYITLPILGILISFCSTNVAVSLSNATSINEQGSVFGTAQALRVLSDTIFTLIAGKLAVFSIAVPIVLGACFIILTSASLFFVECGTNTGISKNLNN
ncbi:MAG: MFS transporter [Gammaproteobacteria bacterium]